MTTNKPGLTRRTILQKGALVAGGLTLGSIAFSGSAAADPPRRIDITGQTISNSCTGEDIKVTWGTIQIRTQTHSDGGSGLHLNVHVNSQGVQAVGDSGRKYQLSGAGSANLNVKPPFPATEIVVANAIVASQGSAENWRLQLRIHLTVNTNGEITAVWFETTDKCKG